ncbi:hypothetical protein D9M71_576760 [compost metagenome]
MGYQPSDDLCEGLEEVGRGRPVKHERGELGVVHHLDHALQLFELLETEVGVFLHEVEGDAIACEHLLEAILRKLRKVVRLNAGQQVDRGLDILNTERNLHLLVEVVLWDFL